MLPAPHKQPTRAVVLIKESLSTGAQSSVEHVTKRLKGLKMVEDHGAGDEFEAAQFSDPHRIQRPRFDGQTVRPRKLRELARGNGRGVDGCDPGAEPCEGNGTLAKTAPD